MQHIQKLKELIQQKNSTNQVLEEELSVLKE